MGKGEIARYKQFLLFPQCFHKACLPGASIGVIVWEWVNPSPNKPWFLCLCSTSLLKTLKVKEKMLVMSYFSFSHSVFYPFGELSAIFIKFKIVVCKLFQFGRVKNMSFGKGLICSLTLYIFENCQRPDIQELLHIIFLLIRAPSLIVVPPS